MTLRPLNRNNFKTNTGIKLTVHFMTLQSYKGQIGDESLYVWNSIKIIFTQCFIIYLKAYKYITVHFYFLQMYVWGLCRISIRQANFYMWHTWTKFLLTIVIEISETQLMHKSYLSQNFTNLFSSILTVRHLFSCCSLLLWSGVSSYSLV